MKINQIMHSSFSNSQVVGGPEFGENIDNINARNLE